MSIPFALKSYEIDQTTTELLKILQDMVKTITKLWNSGPEFPDLCHNLIPEKRKRKTTTMSIIKCEFKPCKRSAIGVTCFCGAYACILHFERARSCCEICKPPWPDSEEQSKTYRKRTMAKQKQRKPEPQIYYPYKASIPFQTETQKGFVMMGHHV